MVRKRFLIFLVRMGKVILKGMNLLTLEILEEKILHMENSSQMN